MQISRKRFEIETWYQLYTLTGNGLWRNDDVIDHVTWPWKVQVMTPISLMHVISKTARDGDLATMGHL